MTQPPPWVVGAMTVLLVIMAVVVVGLVEDVKELQGRVNTLEITISGGMAVKR